MKYISVFFITILLFLNSSKSYSNDSLTTSQQLDRIMEEIKDLNKAVFNKASNKNELYLNNDTDEAERFSSIDIRIYDLEKDIKNLTLQFEEILFRLDDLSTKINLLESELSNEFRTLNNKSKIGKKDSNVIDSEIKEENTLGALIISSDESQSDKENSKNFIEKNKTKTQEQELKKLSAEELLQLALDQMMKKNYNNSKKILKDFIIDFPENQLSGSAHFWLGKIYLFESNFREAAIVFGEGVQKFPNSIKAAEMNYELSKSLKEMNKTPEACKTLSLLEQNYKNSKFAKDPEKIKNSLNCENLN